MPTAFHTRRGAGPFHAAVMLTLAAALGAVLYVSDGYPDEDLLDGESMNAAQHIAALNALGEDTAEDLQHRVVQLDVCVLQFQPPVRNLKGGAFDVPLLTLQTASRTDRGTQTTTLSVESPDGPAADPRDVYQTLKWHEAVAYASHLRQLTRLCADSVTPLIPG